MKKRKSDFKAICTSVVLSSVLLLLPSVIVQGQGEAAGPPGWGNASATRSAPETAVAYDLKEISVFAATFSVQPYFTSGQYVECGREPDGQVKVYPKLQSEHPLYGSFVIGARARHREPGPSYAFVVDESGGTGRGYDRLYLDGNRNGDLTDDEHRTPRPAMAGPVSYGPSVVSVWFDVLALALDANDSSAPRLEVRPHLLVRNAAGQSLAYLHFAGTKAREGAIRIGDQEYQVVLGHNYSISGWFDQPDTALHILDPYQPGRGRVTWGGGTQLSALHRRGDTYYRFAATPAGDSLFVWPYAGPFGTLELGAGGRTVGRMSMTGSLTSPQASLSLSEGLGTSSLPPARSFRVPIGDYTPYMLNIMYDSLQCLVLRNAHADGRPRGRPPSREAGAIRIREDQPFVLDFSTKPQVLFALPARDQRVKLGASLDVKAVLIDPALDIMFRSIRRDNKQLDPKVTIQRTNGEIVAEGVMPFG